ncbi:hypothetical protein [Campylobacter devanensis]|uniref:hypothetical protein n=1 Tax=Campylobacter devanensis TaxID=3161138 RepID=UPI000A3461E5|nr:hypothetical protein [Campylobacter sp. P157]
MKVILLNNNPAVSKLVSVSLNKLGYTFAEIDNLEYLTSNDADLIICDSGLYDSKINYLEYAKNQLFLIPRNRADEYNLAKSQTLQKPFLPTDFIDVVKRILVEIPKSTKIVEPKPSDIKVGDEFGQIHTNDNIDVFSDLNSDELPDDINKLQDDFENSSFDDENHEEQELEQFENLIEVAEPELAKDEFDDDLGLDDESGKIESLMDKSKDVNNLTDDLMSDNKELNIATDEFNLDNIDDEIAKLDSLEYETDNLADKNLNKSVDESQAKSVDNQINANNQIQELDDADLDLDNPDIKLNKIDSLDDKKELDTLDNTDNLADKNLNKSVDESQAKSVDNQINANNQIQELDDADLDLDNPGIKLNKIDSLDDKKELDTLDNTDNLADKNLNKSVDESQAKSVDNQINANNQIQELDDADLDLDNPGIKLNEIDSLDDKKELDTLDNKASEIEALDDLSNDEQIIDNLDNQAQESSPSNKLNDKQKQQNIKDITSEYENIKLDISALDALPDGDGEIDNAEFDTTFKDEIKDESAIKPVGKPELESKFQDDSMADLAAIPHEITECDEIDKESIIQPEAVAKFATDESEQTQPVQESKSEFEFKDKSMDESTQKTKPAFLVEEIGLDKSDNELDDLESELAGFESDLANIKSSQDEYEPLDFDESQDFNELANENDQVKDVEYTENLNKLSSMLDEIDNMDCENNMKNQDLSNSYEASTIDEIEEAAIKEALHEENNKEDSQTQNEPKVNQSDKNAVENKTEPSQNEQKEIAQVLASQIGEGLGRAFSTSALKDVLKDINININISFEGR